MSSPLVAVVDDDPSIRRSLNRLLRTAGYAVETFASGRELLEWLPGRRPLCILLDIHMPGMSGLDLQPRLDAPLVFMTANIDPVTRTRIEQSGARYLLKPFSEEALLHAIRRESDDPAKLADKSADRVRTSRRLIEACRNRQALSGRLLRASQWRIARWSERGASPASRMDLKRR